MINNIEDKYSNPDKRIKLARDYHDNLMLHVHGVGLQKALAQINHYENELQKEARDLFAISNKHVSDRLLRPSDNVFNAKGGYINYYFESSQDEREESFREKLTNVYDGYSLSQYMRKIAFDKYITDPNGIFMLKTTDNGETFSPEYISIKNIRNYEQEGINLSWIVFEPYEEEDVDGKTKEYFQAIDKENYYYYSVSDNKFKLEKQIPLIKVGKVPACLCSDIEDPVTGWKKSQIDPQIELLNKHMNDNSVLNIVEYFHNYPQQWEIVDKCHECMGTGKVPNVDPRLIGHNGVMLAEVNCPVCGGTRKGSRKDPTDKIEVKYNKDGSQVTVPSGYVYMPTEPWELMTKSLDRTWGHIIFSHWGSSIESGGNNGSQYSTATGRWIDVQPVNNKLDEYSDSIEMIHKHIADMIGEAYYPESYKKSMVKYGRNYLIETTNQLITQYNDLGTHSNNTVMRDVILEKWLQTEYRDNDFLLMYYSKINSLDPLPHLGLAEMDGYPKGMVERKMYLNDYKNSMDRDKVVSMSYGSLISDYEGFIKNKKENE